MGFSGDFCSSRDRERDTEKEEEDALLTTPSSAPQTKIPKDSFHFAYIVYFTLGTGYLLPWNAFITAVDYFAFLYPGASVDRVFAVVYMLVGLLFLVGVVGWAHKSSAFLRINLGLLMFVISLSIVPILDLVYVKGRPGLYSGYYVTVAAVAMAAVADALVQSSVIGSAGELPERYMQATVAGTAASGHYYLVDAGFANAPGFLAPFRGVRYHLKDHRGRTPQDPKELFNKRHSQARNVIERAFGLLKGRFAILRTAPQYDFIHQVSIVHACCTLHNLILDQNDAFDDTDETSSEDAVQNEEGGSEVDLAGVFRPYSQRERDEWHDFRDSFANNLWEEYQMNRTHG